MKYALGQEMWDACLAIGMDMGNLQLRSTLTKGNKMTLHSSTFEYLKPTDEQLDVMQAARDATKDYAMRIEALLPDGADKTYIMRKLRELGMWVNVAITREANGEPRE